MDSERQTGDDRGGGKEVPDMDVTFTPTTITGRFTVPELEHLAGTIMWPRGVPETVEPREAEELDRLVEMARAYIETTPRAVAVDILENQILNVVTD
jgi:hypothetical protein